MQNYHIIEVVYIPPTATLPERIKIHSPRFKEGFYINYNDYEHDHTLNIAIKDLKLKGFEIIGYGQRSHGWNIISTTFKPFKQS